MKRRAAFGLCIICAMAISAFAAQGASANTAFTCASGTGKGFSDAHCKTAVSEGAKFTHVEIPVNKTTKITGSNETTEGKTRCAKLHSVQAGTNLELESCAVSSEEGEMTNRENEAKTEMWAEGSGKIIFKGVEVVKPAGIGCVVKGTKEVKTTKLSATTKGLPANSLKFTPASGTVFAEFTIEGCTAPLTALNHLYKAEGSVIGTTNGATTEFEREATTKQATLKLSGQLAGIDGSLTIKGENGNGLALT